MTELEFMDKTARIEKLWNKEFNYEQRMAWLEELKNYSAEKYDKAISIIYKTSQYRPTLSQMLEVIRTIPSKVNNVAKSETCKLCNGTGYVLQERIENGRSYTYALLCNCKNANGKEYDGTKIKDERQKSDFYLEKAENVFLKEETNGNN